MILTARTKVWVASSDDYSVSEMTLEGVFNAIVGGTRIEDIEIATSKEEADKLGKKLAAIKAMNQFMANMTPEQAEKAVELIVKDERVLDLHEPYA